MPTMLYRPWVARLLSVLAGGYFVYYLVWRASATLNPQALLFSLLLLAAEAHGVLSFCLFAFMTWDTSRRPAFALRSGLGVEVFVPTFNEDLDILEATLVGCNGISYPHTTYVLDDGRRPAVEDLALRLGCGYFTRLDNRGAKAGNLNAALARTRAEFVVMLDADTVPQPDFLERTLGYFVDDRVALVQLPQEFYNQDSVQHLEEDWHEQALFYRVIQPGKNRWNSAFWCGSPSVVRRSAVEEVGGVAMETVTEDIHTSIRLHARGWKTVYHDEVLAYGIAPQTLVAFKVQRLRWAQGTMQLLRSRENPLIVGGLSLAQRLNYLASMGTYFDAYRSLVYIAVPSLVLLTGIMPLHVGGLSFAAHWLPYFALGMLANVALGRGTFRFLAVEQYNLLKMFTFLRASATLLWSRALRFRVTPKGTTASVYALEQRELLPLVATLSGISLSLALGIVNLGWSLTASYRHPELVAMSIAWAVANAGLVAIGVLKVRERLYARQSYRFSVRLPMEVSTEAGGRIAGTAENLSRYGVGLTAEGGLRTGQPVTARVLLPDGPLELQGEVARLELLPGGRRQAGLRIGELSPAARQLLLAYLFVTLPRQQTASVADASVAAADGISAQRLSAPA